MTEDQLQAIRQFLSRPAPCSNPCGCMGAQLLQEMKAVDELRYGLWEYNPSDREPMCPCSMKYVEMVNDIYYLIKEHRSPDGITHTAVEMGPRGGPYKLDEYGRPTADLLEESKQKTLSELHGEVKPKSVKDLPLCQRADLANQLASDPKNVRFVSKTTSRFVEGKWIKTTKSIVDGKFVITEE